MDMLNYYIQCKINVSAPVKQNTELYGELCALPNRITLNGLENNL